MTKKKDRAIRSRDAPQKRETSWLCSADAFKVLVGNGYRRLADCPEIQTCVNIYADLISSMTLHLMQNTAKGDIRIKDGLASKIDINPNKLMTRKTFISNIVRVMLLEGDGNQFTYPRYRPDGLLENLEPLIPSRVQIVSNEAGYYVRYGSQTFNPDELLHFMINPDPERPWIGSGYKAVLSDVVKGLKQAGATKQALLESPSPSIIVKVDGLSEEFSSIEGRKKLSNQYLDSSENGMPWFVPAEAFQIHTVKPLTLNDLALASNIELDKRTAAAIMRVPAFMVGVGEFNKDAHNAFINISIMPMAQAIQQEFTRSLLYADDRYFRFNPRSLYAYDLSEIIDAGGKMVDRAALTRNELRDWTGYSPREDMEEVLLLENYLPINRLGDQKKLIGGDEQ